MLTEPDILLEGCPTELEEDLKEIVDLSEDFLDYVDVNPHQNINEIKVDLQEAKNYLFQIISRFATLIDERIDEIILQKEDKDKILTMGWKMKFDDDVGAIMGDLIKKPTDRLEGSIGITTLLKFSGDLKTTYDFLTSGSWANDVWINFIFIAVVVGAIAAVIASSKSKDS